MDDPSRSARRFDAAMLEAYEAWRREIRHSATRFRQTLDKRGGVETARRLLGNPDVSSTFTKLQAADRLELTVEYLVLQRDFAPLFTFEERGTARRRLIDHGMAVDSLP